VAQTTRWRWRALAALAAVALSAPLALAARPGPPAQPPVAAPGTDPAVACQDLRAGATLACLHGNDTPPPGVSLFDRPTLAELEARTTLRSPSPRLRGLAGLEQATEPAATEEPASLSCIGNGTSGNRIQAIYARAPDVPDQYDQALPSLRQWAAEADQAVWVSAGQTGGGRRLRFATEVVDGACQLDVDQILLTPLGDDSFSQMRTELQLQGYNRSDRKYLVWVDAGVGICGLGEVYGDARPGQENLNNGGPMYARVDTPCWHYAELHEIFHTLGAVQPDAPHPSSFRHCTDEADVMCYDDDGGGPVTMTTFCPPEHEALLDCRDDDYFSTSPPDSSYLDSHWNTADSSFLEPTVGALPAQLTLTGAATLTYGGRANLRAQLTDEQTSTGLAGEPVNLFGRRAGASGEQAAGSVDSAADGSASFSPAPTATTTYRASYPGSDTHGTASSSEVTVSVRPKVSARKSANTISYGQTFTVTGTVSPNHHGQRVYLQRLVDGRWKGAASTTLTSGSGYTLRVEPQTRGRLTYRVYKFADADHLGGASASQAVTVR
jgi:hypothetical protein